MVSRRAALAFACALLTGAGCGDSLAPAGGTPRTEEPLWSHEFPTGNSPWFQLASWPNGDFALIGSVFAASDVARFDGSGQLQRTWSDAQPPNGYWQGFFTAADPAGSLYLAGVIVPQPYDLVLGDDVIRKVGPDGVVAWSRAFALWPGGFIIHLEATADGVLTALGTFTGTFDFGGGPITARNGGKDSFRLRLDANGAFISAETIGDPSRPLGIVAVSSSGLIASVDRANSDLPWVLQVLDAGGRPVWDRSFFGEQISYTNPMLAFSGDDVIIGFGSSDATDLGDGLFPAGVPHKLAVARFDRTGTLVWKRGFGSDYNALLSGLAVDSAGDVTLCGFVSHLTDETFAFDSLTIPSPTRADDSR